MLFRSGNDADHVDEDAIITLGSHNTQKEQIKLETLLAVQREEEQKRLKEIQVRTQEEIEKVKQEKERALAELKENNDKQLKDIEEKIMAKLRLQQDAGKSQIAIEASEPIKEEIKQTEIIKSKKNMKTEHSPSSSKKKDKLKRSEEGKIGKPPKNEEKKNKIIDTPKEFIYCYMLSYKKRKYKIMAYGKQNEKKKFGVIIAIKCLDDSSIKINKESYNNEDVKQILNSTSAKDIAPYSAFAKGLRSLSEIMRYGILPFVQIGQDKNIEIWVHASGITNDHEIQVNFLGSICHVDLNYVENNRMRICLSLVSSDQSECLYIDLDYDKGTFANQFPKVDISEYKQDPNEVWLPCFKSVPVEFIDRLDSAFTEIELYLKRTHRGPFSFSDVVKDESLKCIVVSTQETKDQQTLWIIRNKRSHFEIYCKALYEVKNNNECITKQIEYSHDNIRKDYGIEWETLTLDCQRYFAFEVYKRCSLHFPVKNEGIHINIAPLVEVSFCRRTIGSKYKFPFTITLIGFNNEITGIKAVIYNPNKICELGVFFIADKEEWKCTESERKKRGEDIENHSWLPERMRKKGFIRIIEKLLIVQNSYGVPMISYKDKDGITTVEYLENIFINTKKINRNHI